MAKPVALTPHVRADLENISAWLFENWPVSVVENFLDLY